METQPYQKGGILPFAVLAAALIVGSCTEPRETVEAVDPVPTQTLEQSIAQTVGLVSNVPAGPTTEVKVHVGRDEFEVTGPYTHKNLEVFLIHGHSRRAPRRKIMTLEEALEQKVVKVHETGEVQQLAIENLTDDTDIFVQSGDIVQGGKQDRVLSKDLPGGVPFVHRSPHGRDLCPPVRSCTARGPGASVGTQPTSPSAVPDGA